ncbi:MFS transporter [Radiobacillus deserti]|uniref:MFS transporter n=1 Tax=Radiobacillus deserti TaxID=2594883 RepID=A0A516KEM5_9BACI|nr:MFS transporter [Radiobacillus deserti]QDP39863.1 MFS transporter [Radiobacillus deserti]
MHTAKARVVGVSILTAVAILGDAMLLVVLPIYWEDFGLTAIWQIGVLLSVNRFIRLPVNPLVGLFYSRFSLRSGMLIAMILATGTTAAYGLFPDFLILVLARVVWGIAWSLLRLGGFLTIIEVGSDRNRGQLVGLYNGLWGIGGLIGMLAGGFLVDQTSIQFVTTVFVICGLLGTPFVWYLVPQVSRTKKEAVNKKHEKWRTPFVSMVLLTGFMMGTTIFGLFSATLSTLVEHTYENAWTVWIWTIGAASIAGFMQAIRWGWGPFLSPLIGRKLDKANSPVLWLILTILSTGTMFVLLSNISSVGWLLGYLLVFQLLSNVFVVAADTFATNVAAKTNGVKMMTSYTVIVDVGAAVGPLFSYLLLELVGVTIVYLIAGCSLMVFAAIWLTFLWRKEEL